jgi:hypothetical protein
MRMRYPNMTGTLEDRTRKISEVSPELEFSIMLCKQYTKDDSFAYFPVSTWSVLLGTVLLDLLLIRHAS